MWAHRCRLRLGADVAYGLYRSDEQRRTGELEQPAVQHAKRHDVSGGCADQRHRHPRHGQDAPERGQHQCLGLAHRRCGRVRPGRHQQCLRPHGHLVRSAADPLRRGGLQQPEPDRRLHLHLLRLAHKRRQHPRRALYRHRREQRQCRAQRLQQQQHDRDRRRYLSGCRRGRDAADRTRT